MSFGFLFFLLAISAAWVSWKSVPVFAVWVRARRAGAPIAIWRLWAMYFQNLPLPAVADAYASVKKAGFDVTVGEIALHARAGADVRAAAYAFVETRRAGCRVDFGRVCEIDLDEADPDEMVAEEAFWRG